MFSRIFVRVLRVAAFAAIVLVPFAAAAQAPAPATITGVVHDSSGAAVPGATVRITNEENGASLEFVSADRGAYQSEPLPPGKYRIEAILDGFETATRRVTLDAGQALAADVTLTPSRVTESVVVTARRVEEVAQEVPIPVSVVSGTLAADTGAFNVNRLKELIPTVQFYSTNPRNSSINIRGLGAPFGLTNDGLEPGVGLYIDGVFYARPASATLDFLDVDRIEVLRGPQGTLFGKNTTAGAINVTTRKPTFSRTSEVELNYGDLGFMQAKASLSGKIAKSVAGRVSFSGTDRDGNVFNRRTGAAVNDMNNVGLRGQLLFAPSDAFSATFAVDYTRQRPEGYTQLVAGIAPTMRAANRQWAQIAADLHYAPPSYNAFDRLTDVDSPLRSYQDLSGTSATLDWKLGRGRLNSTTSWRHWNWNPSSDRDFVGLPITTISAAPSIQDQWTQEVRYTSTLSPAFNFVVGAFAFHQDIDSNDAFTQEQGSAAARVLLAPTPAALTPGLLDGYGYMQTVAYGNTSAAMFGQFEWSISDRLRVLPGLRFNYDQKDVNFDQQVYGGLQTTDPVLIALQRSVLAPQAYATDVDDTNVSGQGTIAYKVTEQVNAYGSYAKSFKSVGLNLNGVPTDVLGRPVLSAATVKPEDVDHFEAGIKTEPFRNATLNATVFDSEIKDYQAQVTNASVGVLRGYLANAEKVRVRGIELDGSGRIGRHISLYGAAALTDGIYVSFPDAPPPLELTGGPQQSVDISGSDLPGISKWATSLGGEYAQPGTLLGRSGQLFAGADTSYRSSFSSSATASQYLIVQGYSLANARVGFRWNAGWTLTLWSRNLFNTEYYDLLTAAPGNTGLIVGQPGDQRTYGVTLRMAFNK